MTIPSAQVSRHPAEVQPGDFVYAQGRWQPVGRVDIAGDVALFYREGVPAGFPFARWPAAEPIPVCLPL